MTVAIPGFNPVETYEAAIANLAPELVRRPKPEGVSEILFWAGEPLATAEVAAIAQLDVTQTRAALSQVARPTADSAVVSLVRAVLPECRSLPRAPQGWRPGADRYEEGAPSTNEVHPR
jgi:hypothetical protein